MRRLALAMLALMATMGAAATPAGAPPSRVAGEAAKVDLTAHRIRISDHPAFVRVVVDFFDGALGSNDSEAVDPDPFPDGRVSVDVRRRRIQAQAPGRRARDVRAGISQASNRIRVRVSARARRFKYLHRFQLGSPERVVLDLYKSRPPVAGARIRRAPDGCLELADWSVGPRRVRAAGMARLLFENSFRLVVRNAAGAAVGDRIVTVGESARWRRRVAYDVSRAEPGTLEAYGDSAAWSRRESGCGRDERSPRSRGGALGQCSGVVVIPRILQEDVAPWLEARGRIERPGRDADAVGVLALPEDAGAAGVAEPAAGRLDREPSQRALLEEDDGGRVAAAVGREVSVGAAAARAVAEEDVAQRAGDFEADSAAQAATGGCASGRFSVHLAMLTAAPAAPGEILSGS